MRGWPAPWRATGNVSFSSVSVVGKSATPSGELWGCGVAGFVFETKQTVGEGEIEPPLTACVGIEGEVVGVAQMLEVRDGAGEGMALGVPAVQDVDRAAGVVGAVVHIGDEEAVVRRHGEEAHSMQAGKRDVDLKVAWQ
jgi:hypothetical protein